MTLQGIFNTKLGEKIGLWETNVIVQLTGLIVTLIIAFIWGKGNYSNIKDTNKIFLLGGLLSVIIIFTVMKSIGGMGTTYAIGIILIAQLLSAAIIDTLGLFGNEKIKFSLHEFIGVAIMIIGIVIFKWKH